MTAALPESYRNERDRARRLRYARSQAEHRRKKYPGLIPKVSKKTLARLRESPASAVWRDLVVCLQCGGKLKILKSEQRHSHLMSIHNLTDSAYLENWPGAPLVSVAFRKERSHHGRAPKIALRGKARPNLKIRGHVDGRPLKKSDLLPLLTQGLSYVEIGKRVNRHFTSIEDAVRRWNLRSFVQCLKDAPDLKEHLAQSAAPQALPPKKAGRHKKAEESRQYFEVGKMVEEKLASGSEVTAARRSVSSKMKISYASVVRYHKQFRSRVTRDGNMSPISITG